MDPGYIDCFKIQMKFWKLLGIWPGDLNRYQKLYSRLFVLIFVVIYDFLNTLNFYFMPKELSLYVDEMVFYFTLISVLSKAFTFIFLNDDIVKVFDTFNSKMFRPDDEESAKFLDEAKSLICLFNKINTTVSVIAHGLHVTVPFLVHVFLGAPLMLPVCSYSFLSDETIEKFIYPLYLYQCIAMHFIMHYNLHIDSFFLGLMMLSIAQLKILDAKLRNVTCYDEATVAERRHLSIREASLELALNKCIIRYDQISKFCSLYQDIFSVTLFVQFAMASCIICMCLVRFTMPASLDYYLFLSSYLAVMTVQIMVPCWFGTRIIEASTSLSTAIYSCDWTPRSRRFKSSLRLFVERTQKPLSITGGKMFLLSLKTFTSIMNSAYSFFTLLRHMQTKDL